MQRVVIAIGLALAALSLVRVADQAQDGEQALVRWTPQLEALADGRDVYRPADASGRVWTPDGDGVADAREDGEGFPGAPFTALVLAPFASLGPVTGSLVFAALKIAAAAFVLVVALRIAFEPRPVPPLAALLVLAGVARVWASDLAHGNTNLLVLGAVGAALLAWHRRMEAFCGFWIALAATLKVTPVLLLAVPLARRSRPALIGAAAGFVFFLVAIPGGALGMGANLDLLRGWSEQMLLPYLRGRELSPLITQHINQSLLGVLARWCSDHVAIEARPGTWDANVTIAVVHLGESAVHWLHRGAGLVVAGVSFLALRPFRAGPERPGADLRAFAIFALAMLVLSERTWKHHHVVLVLPLAHLVSVAWLEIGRRRALAGAAIATSLVVSLGTGSGVLGDRGSDLAEAYGVHLFGALVLWGACVALQRSPPASPPESTPAAGSR